MVPSSFIQGDVLNFELAPFTDGQGRFVSPPDWELSYHIRGNGNSLSEVAIDFHFSIPSVSTLACKAGRAYYQVVATKTSTGEKSVVQQGPVDVGANFMGTDATFDPRSQDQKDLEVVQNLIRQLMNKGGVIEYRIGTRSLKRYELSDLISLESRLKSRISRDTAAEKIRNGEGNPNSLYVRFK